MNCQNHPDRERTAFCQNCGKPLCPECTRTVGSAVFCEPCLAAKLAGTPGSATGSNPVPPPPIYGSDEWMHQRVTQPGPNPGLAALLGFIPGVGAMYNGQYAKGVVHLVVFAILVSLANENGIFGLFIAGWVCYQVIEAHHTARARRDGTPLPNPFGLNDLGERLGFGKAWPATAANGQPESQPGFQAGFQPGTDPGAPPPPTGTYAPPMPGYPPPSAASWNAPWDNYAQQPTAPPYGTPPYPLDPNQPLPRNRFPSGAIWLIGLGCLFLIGNSSLFHSFPVHRIFPFFLIGLGVWLFVRKMTDTGTSLADDGTPAYRYRLFCALRSSVWVVLIGVLFLLDSFDIVSWAHSWPLFIIVAGLMTIFRRVSYPVNAYPYPPNPYPNPYAAPPTAPPASSDPGTSIVPSTHDQEGR